LVVGITLLGLAILLAGTQPAAGKALDLSLCDPAGHSFTLAIDNPFLPLRVGQRWALVGDEDGTTIGLQITVLDRTEKLSRDAWTVTTRVVEELEWEDADGDGQVDRGEALIEVSRNFYAQTLAGTVCYFGEDVDIYEDGRIVSHEGAWRADAPGNAPGIFMPASPMEGMSFPQEVAPGIAEDEATIVGSGTVEVPAGTFHDTIRVREFNPLDGDKGYKEYARGVGLITDSTLVLVEY
jgi:hypothetical protein